MTADDGEARERWQARTRRGKGRADMPRAVYASTVLHQGDLHDQEHLADVAARDAYVRAHRGELRAWSAVQATVALAVWRTARAHGVPVDDVTLREVLDHLRRRGPELFDEHPVPPAPWQAPDERRHPAALAESEQLLARIAAEDSGRDVGYCVREMRARPETGAQWAEDLAQLDTVLKEITSDWRAGWQPDSADRAAVPVSGLLDPPRYDYPTAPAYRPGAHPTWLQRAAYLTGLAAPARAAADEIPPRVGGPGPVCRLLELTALLVDDLRAPQDEIEVRWAADSDAASDAHAWEVRQVPPALRAQTAATEAALDRVRAVLDVVQM